MICQDFFIVMSKFVVTVLDAKIIFNQRNTPTKRYNKANEFSLLSFDIVTQISKKDQDGQWKNKAMFMKCAIWNEKLANKFIEQLDETKYNFIHIIGGALRDIEIHEHEAISVNGNRYQARTYNNLALNVTDFIISHKDIINNNSDTQEISDEEVPFNI
jgi:hypothetical protein